MNQHDRAVMGSNEYSVMNHKDHHDHKAHEEEGVPISLCDLGDLCVLGVVSVRFVFVVQ
jgi:hypothetical protein